jgi:Trypsin
MDLTRFVRITPRDDPNRGGTGYLLSGTRVLTARHVAQETAALTVHFAADPKTLGTAAVNAVWCHDKLDVAVLTIETGLVLPQCPLDGATVSKKRTWDSRGWTRTKKPSGPLPVHGMEALGGDVHEVTAEDTELTLEVTSPPKGAEWWKGSSGAPVFCGQSLVGVIWGGPENFAGSRLRATPVSALWSDPAFRAHVSPSGSTAEGERQDRALLDNPSGPTAERERRHQLLLAKIAERLEAQPRARALLAKHGPEAWKKARTSAALAAALCETETWTAAAEVFDRAQKEAVAGREAAVADALVELLLMVIPEIFLRHLDSYGDGGQYMSLDWQTETHAEIALAAFDGRRLRYQPVEVFEDFPEGVGLVPLKVPGQDPPEKAPFLKWNLEKERSAPAWIPLLAQWVKVSEKDRDRHAGDLEALAERVSDHLEALVELDPTENPRFYLLLPASVVASSAEFIADLRRLVPALHVASFGAGSGQDYNRERREFQRLQSMLYDFDKRKRGSS